MVSGSQTEAPSGRSLRRVRRPTEKRIGVEASDKAYGCRMGRLRDFRRTQPQICFELHFSRHRTTAQLSTQCVDIPSMSFLSYVGFAGALWCTSLAGAAQDGWHQLKAGMNGTDTTIALGNPLFKNVGRGFELWIYDRGAEAVYYRGVLVAWTAPGGSGGVKGRQLDLRPFINWTPPPSKRAAP